MDRTSCETSAASVGPQPIVFWGRIRFMSDFMLSQVQGLLTRLADDLDKMGRTNNAQMDTVLGAIDDLSANLFATQALLCMMIKEQSGRREGRKSLDHQAGRRGVERAQGAGSRRSSARLQITVTLRLPFSPRILLPIDAARVTA